MAWGLVRQPPRPGGILGGALPLLVHAAVDVQDPVVPLRNEVLGRLASAVDVIGPHDIYRAAGNPSRQHDSQELSPSATRSRVRIVGPTTMTASHR